MPMQPKFNSESILGDYSNVLTSSPHLTLRGQLSSSMGAQPRKNRTPAS